MSGGWRYSVRIPDYTEELQAEESIVSYQLDVLVQAPGSQDASPPASVWRRFSEFRQLHTNLKASYPSLFKGKLLDPPPKKSFFVNHDHKFLNERRVKLEQWMWKLLRHAELAQSRDMKLFLQLHLAMRVANTGGMSPRSSVAGGLGEFGTPDERSEPDTDAFSEISAPSGITTFSNAQTDAMSGFHSSRSYTADGYRGDHMEPQRMGLRVEQRSDLKRLLNDLSRHVEKASRDIQESNLECARLRQENQNLVETTERLTKATDGSGIEEKDMKILKLEQELELKSNSLRDSEAHVEKLETVVEEQLQKLALKEQANKGQAQEGGEDVAALKEQLRALTEANVELEEKSVASKQKSKQDHKLLAKEIAKLRASTQALQSEVMDLRGEKSAKEKAEEALREADETKSELAARVQNLEGMLEKQTLDFQQKLQESENAAAVASSGKVAGMEGRVAELEASCRDLTQRLESLKVEKEQVDALLLEANNRCDASQQKFNELKGALEADVLAATQRCEEAEKQLESLTVEHDRLGKDREVFRLASEEANGLASKARELQVEVDRLESEKLSIHSEREQAVVRAESLAKELNVSRGWEQEVAAGHKSELDELESMVQSLKKENAALKHNQESQAQLMKSHRDELLSENDRLKAENTELVAAREEIALLKSELGNFMVGNGDAPSQGDHDEVLMEYEKLKHEVSESSQQTENEIAKLRSELQAARERANALEEQNRELASVQEKLRLSESRAEQAAQEACQSAQEIALLKLEAEKNLESKQEPAAQDDVSIAQIAELVRLQSEMERLQAENTYLVAGMKAEENGGSGSHGNVANVAEVVRSVHAKLRECSASVPGLSGHAPIDPDVATDLMDKVAESNGKLQLIAAQAQDLKASSNSIPETAALGTAVADMIGELVNKCREVNEIRVDQILSRTDASPAASAPTTPVPIPHMQLNPSGAPQGRNQRGRSQSLGGRFSPESGQGKRGMLSRFAGGAGNGGELDRGSGGQAGEGDSRMKNFLGGIGSKVSTGALNFMQRGNPQLSFGDPQSQSQSLQQPLRSAPDHNAEESRRGNR